MVSNSTHCTLTFDEFTLIREHLEKERKRIRAEIKGLEEAYSVSGKLLQKLKRQGRSFQGGPELERKAFTALN